MRCKNPNESNHKQTEKKIPAFDLGNKTTNSFKGLPNKREK